jgi:hypothetical protein
MPTINPGSPAKVQLGNQDTLTVTGAALVEVIAGAAYSSATVSTSQTFGPYGLAVKLRITATSGAVTTSEVNATPLAVTPVVADQAGQLRRQDDNTPLSTSGGVASVKRRIAASAAVAYRNNPIYLDPWFKPKAWTATTYIHQGEVRASTDGVNQFICKTSGTTAAASPTGAPLAEVTDGTVKWLWTGAIRGVNVAQAVHTQGTGAGVDISGGQVLFPAADGAVIEILGSNLVFNGTNGNNAYSAAQPSGKHIFITDSSKLKISPAIFYYPTEVGFTVSVNGRLIQESAFGAASAAATDDAVLIDLSFWGGLGVDKEIVIYSSGSNAAKFFKIDKGATVRNLPNNNSVRALWDGSSLFRGGNGAPFHWGKDMASQIGSLVGQYDWGNYGLGSTGLINDGASTPYGANSGIGRIATNIPLFVPELVVRCDNHNDQGFTTAQRKASVGQYIAAGRAAANNPQLPFVFFGNTLLQGESSDSAAANTQLTMELEMKAAVAALNDSNVFFIPVLSDTSGSWIQAPGATPGHAGNITGYNADRFFANNGDGHPCVRGYDYNATRYATAIARWANT